MSEHGEPSDEALVAAFVDGDDRAFARLVDRHERRVYAQCLRYFGHPSDAEDALQDTFLTVLRRASTYRGTAAFSTWLYRVTTNTCHDLARRRSRRPRAVDSDVATLAELADVEDAIATRELSLDLAAALAQLDDATRTAIVLHDAQGLPYVDVAKHLNLPVGTVKSRIHRGHARLASALAHLDASAGPPGGTLRSSAASNPQTPTNDG